MPVQRIVLILDINGPNQSATCSRLVKPEDSDNLRVEPLTAGRSASDIILAIKKSILLAQGRDEEAKNVKS
jgi:hypothetical protein